MTDQPVISEQAANRHEGRARGARCHSRLRAEGRFVQIQLRDGAAWSSLSRSTRPRLRKALMFAENGVAVNGWTLHLARLAAAVACFAPAVQVIDASTGLVVNPNKRG